MILVRNACSWLQFSTGKEALPVDSSKTRADASPTYSTPECAATGSYIPRPALCLDWCSADTSDQIPHRFKNAFLNSTTHALFRPDDGGFRQRASLGWTGVPGPDKVTNTHQQKHHLTAVHCLIVPVSKRVTVPPLYESATSSDRIHRSHCIARCRPSSPPHQASVGTHADSAAVTRPRWDAPWCPSDSP
jgi:hypothetical protein